jgi:predicted alpha/beta hydrolase
VVARAHAALPGRPLYLLGHSLGAQLPGLLRNHDRVSGMLSVAAGSGYWRDTAPRIRASAPFLWFVLVPLATALCGYFPGRRLRVIGDIPAAAMMQWRRWCINAHYSVGAEGESVRQRYANVRFPIHALSITDDEMMTLRGIHSLVKLYENAPAEIRELGPAELGARRLGHFGVFRGEHQATLWPRLDQWLAALRPARTP